MSDWYADWQSEAHRARFDGRSILDARNLARNFESFNDVRLLLERFEREPAFELLEVGCATGEFHRYLRRRVPQARYIGVDVSKPAIDWAARKYPEARFALVDPAQPLPAALAALGFTTHPAVVYAKDVIQHQVRPFDFLAETLDIAREAVILRARTRDHGASVLDPEQSCQYHYRGWMPYLVLNVQELIAAIRRQTSAAEIAIYRHHMALGGRQGRFVPKDLYVEETGTAETAIGIFKRTSRPGQVTIVDRPDHRPSYTWDFYARRAWGRVVGRLSRTPAASGIPAPAGAAQRSEPRRSEDRAPQPADAAR